MSGNSKETRMVAGECTGGKAEETRWDVEPWKGFDQKRDVT